MELKQKKQERKLFYGWVVVGASSVMHGVLAAGAFCFGLFVKPMSETYGWSRADVTLAIAIMFIVGPFLFVLTGRICDRHGPKILTLAGGTALTLGYYLSYRTNSLWLFYLGYGVLGGIGFACIFVPLAATISKWFVRSRGLALGILYAVGGIGGLILSPLLQHVINSYGWRSSWLVLTVLTGLVTMPATLLLRKEPKDMGLKPLGSEGSATGTEFSSQKNYTLKEALATRQFWFFNAGIFLHMASVIGVQHNLVPYATDKGITATSAAMALGIASGCNAFGRITMGFGSDRIGTRNSVFITTIGAVVALFYLLFVDRNWMLISFTILFGIVYGGFVPMNARVIADLFGTENMGAIMGLSGIFAALGPAFGPVLMAAVYDKTGSYTLSFLLAGIAVIISFLLYAALKLPRKNTGPVKLEMGDNE